MNEREAMLKMRDKGIIFNDAKALITPENMSRIARDAALVTGVNAGVPAVMTT